MISSSPVSSCSNLLLNNRSPQSLLKFGIRPSIQSLNLLLWFLFKSKKLPLLLRIFSQISSNSIQVNARTQCVAARAMLKSKHFSAAEELLCSSGKNSKFTTQSYLFDSLLRGLSTVERNPERAFLILRDCVEDRGVLPSVETFRLLVLSLSRKGEMGIALQVLELIKDDRVGYPVDNFMSSSIISGFSKIGKPDFGVEFYHDLEKNGGFEPNLITYTAAVDALCKQGRVNEACELVKKMEDNGVGLDEVLYSCWIHGYFRIGDLMEGLRTHQEMFENRVAPDLVTYTILIDGLCKHVSVEKVIGFLNEMDKNGLKPNLVTCTVIVRGFCSKGKMEEAYFLFHRLKELDLRLDEFLYATLIDGLCMSGDMDRVFELLEEMEKEGIEAGIITYNTVINGLCKAGRTSDAVDILNKFDGDNFTYATLLHGYVREKDVEGAMQMKKRLEKAGVLMDVVTLNVLLKIFFMAGMVEDAYQLFGDMPELGLFPTHITYSTVIGGLCKSGMLEKAVDVFNAYKRSTVASSCTGCHNPIIRELCNRRKVEMAIEVFRDLLEKNLAPSCSVYRKLMQAQFEEQNGEGVFKFIQSIVLAKHQSVTSICNDALYFLCMKGSIAASLNVYMVMLLEGLTITSKSFYILIKHLLSHSNKQIAQVITGQSIKACGISSRQVVNGICLYLSKQNVAKAVKYVDEKDKVKIPTAILNAIVKALLEGGQVEEAQKFLFQAIEKGMAVDVVICSMVVDKICKEGYLETALDLCGDMQKKGIHPNIVLYNSVINGLCRQGYLMEAFRLFDSLEMNNVIPTVTTYATLIDALCRESFLDDANQLFARMILKGISPNIHVYNSLIKTYCRLGLIENALKLLLDVDKNCLQVEDFTVSSVISGYCSKGNMEGALELYSEYKGRGIYPDFLGFFNLIKGLFAKGRMEEARSILRDMLQGQAIIDLINKAGNELHVDSLSSLLVLACEQGRIKEVILVLDEVGSTTLFTKKPEIQSRHRLLKKIDGTGDSDMDSGMRDIQTIIAQVPDEISWSSDFLADNKIDLTCKLCKMGKESCNNDSCKGITGKSLQYDINTCYSMVASYCSKGELAKANSTIEAMLNAS